MMIRTRSLQAVALRVRLVAVRHATHVAKPSAGLSGHLWPQTADVLAFTDTPDWRPLVHYTKTKKPTNDSSKEGPDSPDHTNDKPVPSETPSGPKPGTKDEPVGDVDREIKDGESEIDSVPIDESIVESVETSTTSSGVSTGTGAAGSAAGAAGGSDGGKGDKENNDDDGDSPKQSDPPTKTFPPLLAIPMSDRPPLPGRLFSIFVTDPEVVKAVEDVIDHQHPHFVLFHLKPGTEEGDVIYSKDEVHQMGVHCDISKLLKNDDKSMIVAYALTRCRLESLTTPDLEGRDIVEESEEFPTAYLNKYRVSYATTTWVQHEPYDKQLPVIRELVEEIKQYIVNLTVNNAVAREQLTRAGKFDPHLFADYAASLVMTKPENIQGVLDLLSVQERLEKVLTMVQVETEVAKYRKLATDLMRQASIENQLKALLREFLFHLRKAAGINEKGDKERVVLRILEKAEGLKLSEEAQEVFEYELEKLRSQSESNLTELYVMEKYLDWLVLLPWGKFLKDHFNLKQAKATLERDHYGLEEVKQRILEFISTGRITGNVDGKILCLAGPPGTGKTSIAKLIADALNRKYVRIAMGGVQDVHELKGHRRTYVGSVPGRIIMSLKLAKTQNPLMLIDEIDKLDMLKGGGALLAFLEILDPEQNHLFLDNYMDVKFDLSNVLFVCTANYLGNIPPPLKDRMEVIEVPGYTTNEKVQIAKRHLIPEAARKAGLENDKVNISDDTLLRLIERYCRESGLRNTKKHINRIFSKAAFKIVEKVEEREAEEEKRAAEKDAKISDDVDNKVSEKKVEGEPDNNEASSTSDKSTSKDSSSVEKPERKRRKRKTKEDTEKKSSKSSADLESKEKEVEIFSIDELEKPPKLEVPDDIKLDITPDVLKDYIGPEIFTRDRIYDILPAGVATGLAYTGSGSGDALYIESILTNSIASGTGSPGVKVTGHLKDVMKESALISYSFSKLFMTKKFPQNRFFEAAEVHVHCPDGAVPKDGPSAGISFTTSLLSLALNRPIPANIAMTGELTVTGRVLSVGGLREKVLGAKRYGCDTIIFPKDIENVLDDIPEETKSGITFVPVEWYDDVFAKVFPLVSEKDGNGVWDTEFNALDQKRDKKK